MSNQLNYGQEVPVNPKAFSVSRIAQSENDTDIILGRLPGKFGFSSDDNIEMHFYDSQNKLFGSVIVPVSSGIVIGRTVLLPDGSTDEKIIVDMTRVQKELGLFIAPGTYTVSINFFANEIGSYTNPKMIIEEVSPSRTELRLGFTSTITQSDQVELFEFTQQSVPRVVAAGIVSDTLGLNQPTQEPVVQEVQTILGGVMNAQVENFVDSVINELEANNPNLLAQLADLEPETPDNLRLTIEFLSTQIYDEFISLLEKTKNTKQFDRLQSSEMSSLVQQAIDNAMVNTNINLFTQGVIRYSTPLP